MKLRVRLHGEPAGSGGGPGATLRLQLPNSCDVASLQEAVEQELNVSSPSPYPAASSTVIEFSLNKVERFSGPPGALLSSFGVRSGDLLHAFLPPRGYTSGAATSAAAAEGGGGGGEEEGGGGNKTQPMHAAARASSSSSASDAATAADTAYAAAAGGAKLGGEKLVAVSHKTSSSTAAAPPSPDAASASRPADPRSSVAQTPAARIAAAAEEEDEQQWMRQRRQQLCAEAAARRQVAAAAEAAPPEAAGARPACARGRLLTGAETESAAPSAAVGGAAPAVLQQHSATPSQLSQQVAAAALPGTGKLESSSAQRKEQPSFPLQQQSQRQQQQRLLRAAVAAVHRVMLERGFVSIFGLAEPATTLTASAAMLLAEDPLVLTISSNTNTASLCYTLPDLLPVRQQREMRTGAAAGCGIAEGAGVGSCSGKAVGSSSSSAMDALRPSSGEGKTGDKVFPETAQCSFTGDSTPQQWTAAVAAPVPMGAFWCCCLEVVRVGCAAVVVYGHCVQRHLAAAGNKVVLAAVARTGPGSGAQSSSQIERVELGDHCLVQELSWSRAEDVDAAAEATNPAASALAATVGGQLRSTGVVQDVIAGGRESSSVSEKEVGTEATGLGGVRPADSAQWAVPQRRQPPHLSPTLHRKLLDSLVFPLLFTCYSRSGLGYPQGVPCLCVLPRELLETKLLPRLQAAGLAALACCSLDLCRLVEGSDGLWEFLIQEDIPAQDRVSAAAGAGGCTAGSGSCGGAAGPASAAGAAATATLRRWQQGGAKARYAEGIRRKRRREQNEARVREREREERDQARRRQWPPYLVPQPWLPMQPFGGWPGGGFGGGGFGGGNFGGGGVGGRGFGIDRLGGGGFGGGFGGGSIL